MILTHGSNSICRGGGVPEIIFASDDFVNIHAGTVLSTNVTQGDTSAFSSKTWEYKGVLQNTYATWNASKRIVDFIDRTITIEIPFSNMTEFSQQFYYACNSDTGRFYYSGNQYSEIFSVYNDSALLTLECWLSNKTAYNGASIGTGPWSTDMTPISYNSLGNPIWIFVSVVGKKISDTLWQIYFYVNGTLYFSYRQSYTTDELTIWETKHSSTSPYHCYLSEMMIFSYSRASQDMQSYDTNNYAPLY